MPEKWERQLLYKMKRNLVFKYMKEAKNAFDTKNEGGKKQIYKRVKIDKRKVDEVDDEEIF